MSRQSSAGCWCQCMGCNEPEVCDVLLMGLQEQTLASMLVQHTNVALPERIADEGLVAGNLLP